MGRTDGIDQQDILAATAQFPGRPGAEHAGPDDNGIPSIRAAREYAADWPGAGEGQ